MTATGTRRLFFALWPDPALREAAASAVDRLASLAPGRPQHAAQLHVTLAFLGTVADARLAEACAAAAHVPVADCILHLDRLDYWPRPRVLCLCASAPPTPLLSMVEALHASLGQSGFQLERRPWRPHLTVLRDAGRPAALPVPAALAWPVRGFALLESVSDRRGVRYLPLGAWPHGLTP